MRFTFVLLILVLPFTILSQDYSVDKKLGEEGKAKVEASMGIYKDDEKTKQLTAIGNKLVNNLSSHPFQYQFFIVDMGEPNAFALPGGYIFFTRGILALANSEDELAGVMGHEIIHSNNRHSIKQRKKGILPGLLILPGAIAGVVAGENAAKIFSPLSKGGEAIMASHSRKDEYEADELGIQLSARSGYDPISLGSMLNTLTKSVEVFTGRKETPSYFNDHPYTADRVERINKGSKALTVSPDPGIFKDKREFLKFVDGVIVGPNPNQGVFKDEWFMHPDLNFKLKIPSVWIRENSMQAVAAMDSSQNAIVMLELEGKAKSSEEAANSFAENFQKKNKMTLTVKPKEINGYTAHECGFVTTQEKEQIAVMLVWIEYNKLIFKLTGASTPDYQKDVTGFMESFSPLSKSERSSIAKRILKVVESKKGEDLASLSSRTQNVINTQLTASINGIPEDKTFDEGELVKVVIEVPY